MKYTNLQCILIGITVLIAASPGNADTSGNELYQAKCGACHSRGQFGMAVLFYRSATRDKEAIKQSMLDERDGLQETFIRTVVRSGLRNMPPLTRVEVSDSELESISAFLAAPNGAQ